MANNLVQHAIIFCFISLSVIASAIPTTTTPPPPPQISPFLSPLTSLTQILTTLGYNDLATASHSLSLSSDLHLPWFNAFTVFAPTDSSFRTCHSCSLSLLLKQHSISGLYPFTYLQTLIFGTKIETLHLGHCLTVTSTTTGTVVFINGAEITRPNLYVSDTLIVHGIQGFISHLSPYSCSVLSMTSLSLPHLSPSSGLTRLLITDAMIRLRTSGLTVLSLSLRVKFAELSSLHNMTIFAVDDESIFHGGHSYVHSIRYHIIPNRVLKLVDLKTLALGTTLPTLEIGEFLTVTTPGGGGGVLSPMRINYVKITKPNYIHNAKLVVHGIPSPFPRIRKPSGGSTAAPSPVMESTVEVNCYHEGL